MKTHSHEADFCTTTSKSLTPRSVPHNRNLKFEAF